MTAPIFAVNPGLVAGARSVLYDRPNTYWVIGGACSGKSTVCQAIAASQGVAIYDMDEYAFGHYMSRYRPERHPASLAWFTAPEPFAWIMSLPWEAFNALYRAANAECLDLLADDLAGRDPALPLLIDGGITHPSVLAQALAPDRVACLATTEADRIRTWETAPDREEMRAWVRALPDPEAMWTRFLEHDEKMTAIIAEECRAHGIRIFQRDEHTPVAELAAAVSAHFGLAGV